jgi:hypothetical protein
MTKIYFSSLVALVAVILFYVFSAQDYFNNFFPNIKDTENKGSETNINKNKQANTQLNDENMAAASDDSWKNAENIYGFSATNIDNQSVEMSKYK